MTPQAAANELKAMLDAMDPRFLTWDREQRKVEALSMAIVLLKKEREQNVNERITLNELRRWQRPPTGKSIKFICTGRLETITSFLVITT